MIAPPKPPSRDELEALIKEARARHLRRRLLGAAGVAVTAALGLSAYALIIGGGGQAIHSRGSAGAGCDVPGTESTIRVGRAVSG